MLVRVLPVLILAFVHIPVLQAANKFRAKGLYKLCASCHGDQGEGKQSIGAPAIAGMPAWYIKKQLIKFRDGIRGRHPKDIAGLRMRPMARMLKSEEDIDLITNYVAKKEKNIPKETIKGKRFKGEKQYQVCIACHGKNGEGNQALGSPPLTHLSDWYMIQQLKNFKDGLRGADPSKDAMGATMRPMAMMLDEQAMKDVVSYIQTLRR